MGRSSHRFTQEYLDVTPEFDPTGPNHPQICRVSEIRGKGLVQLQLADGNYTLAVLPPKFRGVLWLRRGALVIASEIPRATETDDKVTLTIEHLLTKCDIKEFTKKNYIPEEFKRPVALESSSEEEQETDEESEEDLAEESDDD